MSIGFIGNDSRQRSLAGTGRPPEDHGKKLAGFNDSADGLVFSDQVILANDLV
jgi:hypothetical protein